MVVRDQLDDDLAGNATALNRLAAQYAGAALRQEVRTSDFSLVVHLEEPGVYVAETDLSDRTGIGLQQAHKLENPGHWPVLPVGWPVSDPAATLPDRLTDAEFARLNPLLPPRKSIGRPRAHPM